MPQPNGPVSSAHENTVSAANKTNMNHHYKTCLKESSGLDETAQVHLCSPAIITCAQDASDTTAMIRFVPERATSQRDPKMVDGWKMIKVNRAGRAQLPR